MSAAPPLSQAPALTPEQQALVRRAAGLAERIARATAARYGALVAFADLVAIGHAGLVEAALAFDPSQGVPFPLFATYRVQGAMLDAIRKEAAHAHARLVASRGAALEFLASQRHEGDVLTDTEADCRKRLAAFSDGLLAAMFAGWLGGSNGSPPEDDVVQRETYERAIRALRGATASLPELDRRVIELHYLEGRDLRQVAHLVGVSYASVRRHRDAALQKLAARLRAQGVTEAPSRDFTR